MTFEADCSSDVIKFVQNYEQIHYYMADPAWPVYIMPFFTRTHSSCLVQCKVTSPFTSYQQPAFVNQMDSATGSFVIETSDPYYSGKSITTELECTSVVSQVTTRDSFEVIFKELPDMSGLNPCLGDEIYFTAAVNNFDYVISYPANKLMVSVNYN